MSELYLIFALIALLLFAAIAAYSWILQRNKSANTEAKSEGKLYVDPLFAELENPKLKRSGKTATHQEPLLDFESEAEPKSALTKSANEAAPSGGKADDSAKRVGADTKASLGANSTVKQFAEHASAKTKKDGSPNDSPNGSPNGNRDDLPLGEPKFDASSTIVTELVARVKNPEPIEQQALLALFREYDFKFHRKVHIYGLNQLTDLWRDIELELPSARFVELGVAIQLADRDGAMSKKELHDFQQMTLGFSNTFDAPFTFSMEIDDAMKQAQILDQIGRRYDSMAVLNVVPRSKSGFRMADIESCARDLMMTTDKNGIFVKTKGQKQNLSILYRLACTDGSGHFGVTAGTMTPVHDLVIYMNVPATQVPDQIFEGMAKDANNLATWLDGKVVDRKGKVMTQRSYSILLQQISDIAYSMQQDGLIPGDTVSKKLF